MIEDKVMALTNILNVAGIAAELPGPTTPRLRTGRPGGTRPMVGQGQPSRRSVRVSTRMPGEHRVRGGE